MKKAFFVLLVLAMIAWGSIVLAAAEQETSVGLLASGIAHAQNKEPEQAMADFNQAIADDPGCAEAYFHRGLLNASLGNYDAAIADLNTLMDVDTAYTFRGLLYRGIVYIKKGDYDQGISDISLAVEGKLRDPEDFSKAFLYRGLAYAKQNSFDEAIADLANAIQIDGKNGDVFRVRATAYYGKKDYDKAWEDVLRAESLGAVINPAFLEDLKKASGRQK